MENKKGTKSLRKVVSSSLVRPVRYFFLLIRSTKWLNIIWVLLESGFWPRWKHHRRIFAPLFYYFTMVVLFQRKRKLFSLSWFLLYKIKLNSPARWGMKDQGSLRSSTTPDPGYQWESDILTVRHHKREPRGQPFPSRWPQSTYKPPCSIDSGTCYQLYRL